MCVLEEEERERERESREGGREGGREEEMVWVVSPDDDTLVLVLYQHVPVHAVRQGPDVGRVLIGRLYTHTHTHMSHTSMQALRVWLRN